MINRSFLHECLILDTDCMINLYASGQMQAILEALPVPVGIALSVYQKPHVIYRDSDDSVTQVTEEINVKDMVEKKQIFVIGAKEDIEEKSACFAYISMIDDDEAVTNALAAHYHWSLGTDDLQSIALLAKQAPGLQHLSTADIVGYWIEVMNPSPHIITMMLKNMRDRALYEPSLAYDLPSHR